MEKRRGEREGVLHTDNSNNHVTGWASLGDSALRTLVGPEGEACAVVCLDTPVGTHVGLDLKSYAIGKRFQGLKLAPPGLRFLHYRVRGADGLAHGVFLRLGRDRNRVAALRWRSDMEDFQLVSQEDRVKIEAAVLRFELDSCLGPYDVQNFNKWHDLTGYWREEVFERAGIEFGAVVIGNIEEQHRSALESDGLSYCAPSFTILPEITEISKRIRAAANSSEKDVSTEGGSHFLFGVDGKRMETSKITELALDPTELILKMVQVDYSGDFTTFLGELQLAFVIFIYLASLRGLEFWKTAVHLISSSTALKRIRTGWVRRFLHVLGAQFFLLPRDLFVNDILSESFFVESLSNLLETDGTPSELSSDVAGIKEVIRSRYGNSIVVQLEKYQEESENYVMMGVVKTSEILSSADSSQEITTPDVDRSQSAQEKNKESRKRMAWMLPPN